MSDPTDKRAAAIEALRSALIAALPYAMESRIDDLTAAIERYADARLAAYLRAPEAEGGGTTPSDCIKSPFVSRACERGTRGCNVRHDASEEGEGPEVDTSDWQVPPVPESELRRRIAELEAKLSRVETERDKNGRMSTQRATDLARAEKRIAELEADVRRLTTERDAGRIALDKLADDHRALSDAHEAARIVSPARMAELEAELGQAKHIVAEYQRVHPAAEGEIKRLRAARDAGRIAYDKLADDHRALRSRIAELEAERAILTRQRDNANDYLTAAVKRAEEAANRAFNAESERDRLRDLAHDGSGAPWVDRAAELQRDLEQARAALASVEAKARAKARQSSEYRDASTTEHDRTVHLAQSLALWSFADEIAALSPARPDAAYVNTARRWVCPDHGPGVLADGNGHRIRCGKHCSVADRPAEEHTMRADPPMDLEIMGGPYAEVTMAVGEFHARDGLTFMRRDDGTVIIRRWVKEDRGWMFYSLTARPLEAGEWASVVAACTPACARLDADREEERTKCRCRGTECPNIDCLCSCHVTPAPSAADEEKPKRWGVWYLAQKYGEAPLFAGTREEAIAWSTERREDGGPFRIRALMPADAEAGKETSR